MNDQWNSPCKSLQQGEGESERLAVGGDSILPWSWMSIESCKEWHLLFLSMCLFNIILTVIIVYDIVCAEANSAEEDKGTLSWALIASILYACPCLWIIMNKKCKSRFFLSSEGSGTFTEAASASHNHGVVGRWEGEKSITNFCLSVYRGSCSSAAFSTSLCFPASFCLVCFLCLYRQALLCIFYV